MNSVPTATGLAGIAVRRNGLTPVPERSRVELIACVVILLLVAAPLPYLLRGDHGHYVTALIVTATLAACTFYNQRGTVAATMVYLALLGDYRRYAGYFQGYPQSDPLLIVAPFIAMLLLVQAMLRSRWAPRTRLAGLVLALMLLMGVEMFNPSQGGLDIGIAGALFYLAPLLWFWVGRSYATQEFAERFTRWIMLGVGVAAMLVGLYQSYFGLFAFEQQWVDQIGYGALYIAEDVVRAIGFFNSSAEYQHYLVVTSVTLFALWLTTRSRLILALPLFLITIFLSAARGPLVMSVLAISFVWAVAARNVIWWLPRLCTAAAVGGCALIVSLVLLQNTAFKGRVAPLVDRQVSGLLNPGDRDKSTANGHLEMLADGLVAGIMMPAGLGLGATTVAAEKYGGRNRSAEVDLANIMISTGILGGLLYLTIIVTVLGKAIGWWARHRRTYALVAVGILVATAGGWLIGGEYSMAALLWFHIGMMDRLSAQDQLASKWSRVRAYRPGHA